MFEIALTNKAKKIYESVDNKNAKKINTAFDDISKSPFSGKNIKRLKGKLEGLYRYRTGNWRIVYSIEKEVRIVSIIWIGKRKDAY
ncbi:type II toxin-antitoxin system RelE/ParE family toxin [Bacteroidota bacterium]